MLYLVFNEGYSAGAVDDERASLPVEAIRLARLLLRLYPAEPEIMALLALMLLHHSRAEARFDAEGQIILMDDQDRRLWNRDMIGEGLALIDKAIRHRRGGPYQVKAAIAALHARAASPDEVDWAQIDALYQALELMEPSPIVTLNRAVAVSKTTGPEAALAMIEPLEGPLAGYFNYFGAKRRAPEAAGWPCGRGAARRSTRAIALAVTPAQAAHIRHHLKSSAGSRGAAPEAVSPR